MKIFANIYKIKFIEVQKEKWWLETDYMYRLIYILKELDFLRILTILKSIKA